MKYIVLTALMLIGLASCDYKNKAMPIKPNSTVISITNTAELPVEEGDTVSVIRVNGSMWNITNDGVRHTDTIKRSRDGKHILEYKVVRILPYN